MSTVSGKGSLRAAAKALTDAFNTAMLAYKNEPDTPPDCSFSRPFQCSACLSRFMQWDFKLYSAEWERVQLLTQKSSASPNLLLLKSLDDDWNRTRLGVTAPWNR
jgi:hypothetical protein